MHVILSMRYGFVLTSFTKSQFVISMVESIYVISQYEFAVSMVLICSLCIINVLCDSQIILKIQVCIDSYFARLDLFMESYQEYIDGDIEIDI